MNNSIARPPRSTLLYTIYIVLFGTAWGLGASVLAGTLPPDPITRAIVITWYEVIILVLAKCVLLRPFVATQTMLVATIISIFTFSFGPPNPYKPLIAFAGLAFDIGTRLRTTNLSVPDMLVGLLCYIPVAYAMFALMFYIIDRAILSAILPFIPIAAAIYFFEGVVAIIIIGKLIPSTNPPYYVQRIRDQITPESTN